MVLQTNVSVPLFCVLNKLSYNLKPGHFKAKTVHCSNSTLYEICNWSPKSIRRQDRGYSYSDVDPWCLVNPGGPPPPSWFEFPCLVPVSLLPPALTCTLQPPAASALVRIPCLYPSPLEHGSRQWGDRHNSIPLLLLSLSLSMSPGSHTQTFPWPFKQWPIWGQQLQVAPRLQYHALEVGKYLKILLVRYSNCIFPCVVI